MRLSSLAIASLLAAGTTTLFADSFTPYSNVNHPITTSSPVTYSGANGLAGGITAYFYSVSAGDTDTTSVYDASQGTFLSPTNAFNNQASGTIGSSVVFDSASLHNGDTLYFVLSNQQIPGIFSSDAHSADAEGSTDGYDHAYITLLRHHRFLRHHRRHLCGYGRPPIWLVRLGLQRRHLCLHEYNEPQG